ncbi:hypothetical protein DXG01_006215 [Tephrocybe rancida]|nr:hypothetical protein DXG01_006215 [Tephrocybe rancida]
MATASNPPPTVNNLDRHQRMRLVRSNRKLEAILGTVPYYLEPTSPQNSIYTTKANRREGRFFAHSPTSSSASSSSTSLDSIENKAVGASPTKSSPASKQSPRALELSRPLLLRLRSVPVTPSDNRAGLLSPPLPSNAPISPISPTFTIDLEKLQATNLESRRKKMAKLTRTLGENIPPELVFHSPKSASTEKPLKSRSLDRGPIPSFTATPVSPSNTLTKPPPVISRPKAKYPRSRPKLPPVPSTKAPAPTPPAAAAAATLPPCKSSKAPGTIAERRRKPRPRSLSLSTGTDMLIAAAHSRSQAETTRQSEDVLVADIVAPVVRTEVFTVRASIDAYGKHQYLTIDEKATKDIFESRSPLPFQAVIPVPRQHRHTHSSPTDFGFGPIETAPAAPQHRHTKSVSASQSPKSAQGAPSAFRRQFGRRKELGWSGEWNQDIEEVVKNLRNLKAR